MQKINSHRRGNLRPHAGYKFWIALSVLVGILGVAPGLYAQNTCMTRCGTQMVACDQAPNLLCGVFAGSIDISITNPADPTQTRPLTTLDLAVVLDDLGPNNDQWVGYVNPPQSLAFPIMNPGDPPAAQRGPRVVGSNQKRTCTEDSPCVLVSESFDRTRVSGINVVRQFSLIVTQIEYEDEAALRTPRALIGRYTESINNYILGQTILVNGTFRLARPTPLASRE